MECRRILPPVVTNLASSGADSPCGVADDSEALAMTMGFCPEGQDLLWEVVEVTKRRLEFWWCSREIYARR